MNYRHISLAREYKLISDENIESWAYSELQSSSEPQWWFSFLVSARTLDSVESILADAANETELGGASRSYDYYADTKSWFLFLALVVGKLDFNYVYSEVVEEAEHAGSKESVMLSHVLNGLHEKFNTNKNNFPRRWIDLFNDSEMLFFNTYIAGFLKTFNIDALAWLAREIPHG